MQAPRSPVKRNPVSPLKAPAVVLLNVQAFGEYDHIEPFLLEAYFGENDYINPFLLGSYFRGIR